MNSLSSSSEPANDRRGGGRQCVFCLEDIRPGASTCPHCGGNLAPLQQFADKHAELEGRILALEQEVATLRADRAETEVISDASNQLPAEPAAPLLGAEIKWPHMADNIILGVATLLAAHWLATTLPGGNRTIFRLVALVVALPFGYRFEHHARTGTTGQVVAALAFGSLGTLVIGVLDLAIAGSVPPLLTAQDVVASVAAIALSHYAGSALAHAREVRVQRDTANAATVNRGSGAPASLMRLEPARIKTTAETVKALYDAAAPIAAGAAALWAAFGHTLF